MQQLVCNPSLGVAEISKGDSRAAMSKVLAGTSPRSSPKNLHSEKPRPDSDVPSRLPQLMERPELKNNDSSDSASSDDILVGLNRPGHEAAFDEEEYVFAEPSYFFHFFFSFDQS